MVRQVRSQSTICDDEVLRQPTWEWMGPFLFLAIFLSIYFGLDQYRQLTPFNESPLLNYPVWFTEGGTGYDERVYCFPNDIRYCAENKTSLNPCCTFLLNGDSPHDTFSMASTGILIVVVALSIFLISCALSMKTIASYEYRHALAELNAAMFGASMAVSLMVCPLEFFKKKIGAPRPNFYSLAALFEYNNRIYSKYDEERFKNVPSGHTAIPMGLMLYVSIYMVAKFRAHFRFDPLNPIFNLLRNLGIAACFVPVSFALWIAATRLVDFWHSNAAIALGIMIGSVCAVFAWQVAEPYFLFLDPPLSLPTSRRGSRIQALPPKHDHDQFPAQGHLRKGAERKP